MQNTGGLSHFLLLPCVTSYVCYVCMYVTSYVSYVWYKLGMKTYYSSVVLFYPVGQQGQR